MKKTIMLAVVVTGVMVFAGLELVAAHGGFGWDDGGGYCGRYYAGDNSTDPAAVEKFDEATRAIRRSLVVKRSELRALFNGENVDEKRVAQLTGEIFDLETDLDKKAAEAGLYGRSAFGYGPGMMRGNGYSRPRGRGMMGW